MHVLAELIGESPAIAALREQVSRLLQHRPASQRLPPVLLLGETGTGKGLLARLLHRIGPRAGGPFVDINCAAIPDTLLEAELFGFERGAFTDARQAKPGLFQAAHGGTIFLDEVGLLPGGLQGKLLKVIEEREVRRLGGIRSEAVDVWVLAASNADLQTEVRARRFREDLYHRLAVLTLALPPLRERGHDILRLAQHFLARACADYSLSPKSLAPDAQAALLAHRWSGNIRELGNVIERVALLSSAALVTAEALGLSSGARRPPSVAAAVTPPAADAGGGTERARLLEALTHAGWNISRTAATLGISRNVLRYRIDKLALRRGEPPPPPARPPDDAPAALPDSILQTVPPEAPPSPGVRWEGRRLTWLRAVASPAQGVDSSRISTRGLETLVAKVQGFCGRIEEVSSTGIVASFGLEPVEDAPALAALAGVAIQKATERAGRDHDARFTVTVAIHVGPSMIARIGGVTALDQDAKRQAWAILDELVRSAEPGSLLVSEAAAPLLDRRFDLVPVSGLAPIPGRAYRLAGPERAGLAPGRRMTHFVGRRRELELLSSRLALALGGPGQVVGIVGEAGIGKSRLLYEFRQSLRKDRVTYLEGRCLAHGSATPYLPVVQMLRRTCRLSERDTPRTIVEKVWAALKSFGIEPGDTAPYLLQFLSLTEGVEPLSVLSPEAIQSRTFEILRQMTLSWTRRRALILAVENLHWADRSTEAYLQSLVDSLAGTPALILLTYRPGYRSRWMDRSYATQISLPPLALDESLRVVHSILPAETVPESLTRLIVAKAEGNPFFLEELARAVREHEGLPETLAVPDTIEQVLLARIDRLAPEPRGLLQTASVLGREVPVRLLRAIWDGGGDLESHLRELVRLEFIFEQPGDEDRICVFRHALTQDVAYGTLAAGRRQALHEAAGRALETFYAGRLEEADDRLAYHYSGARNHDRAVEYLSRVADRAARAFAHAETITALRNARAHAEELEAGAPRNRLLLDLALRLARALNRLGKYDESLSLLGLEGERVDRLDDPTLTGPYHFWLGRTWSALGDHERSVQHARRALGEAERCGDDATMGKAYFALAYEGFWSGRLVEGAELARRAVALLEHTAERWWLGIAHWILGVIELLRGELDAALEAEATVKAIGETMGDPHLQSSAAWTEGAVRALRGEWQLAIETCKRGVERCTDPVDAAVALGVLGGVHAERGDAAEAIPLLERSVEECGRFGVRNMQGWFTAVLGDAYLMAGEHVHADHRAREAIRLTGETGFRHGLGWAQRTLGRAARARGALDDAAALLGQALGTFTVIDARFEAGRTHLDMAELDRARGDEAGAARHLSEAHQFFAALRIPVYEVRAREFAAAIGVPLPA